MSHAVPVVILGLGGVGRALVRVIASSRQRVASRVGAVLRVVAVCDSAFSALAPQGSCFSDETLEQVCAAKERRQPLKTVALPVGAWESATCLELVERAVALHGPRLAVADVTASDATLDAVCRAVLELGSCAALANKRPVSACREKAMALLASPRLRHESTVGGGDPVIAGLRYLLDVGETPVEICGEMSGSLAYMFRRMSDGGLKLSEAVAECAKLGYTEPDPRDDLGGVDSARKLLILARACNVEATAEMSDVAIEPLLSPEIDAVCGHPPRSEDIVHAVAESLDTPIATRLAAAKAKGCVLRFVARVTGLAAGEKLCVRVGIEEVAATDLLSVMPPHVSIRTAGAWSKRPLIISGALAGSEMTAAGVLGDIVALIREKHL